MCSCRLDFARISHRFQDGPPLEIEVLALKWYRQISFRTTVFRAAAVPMATVPEMIQVMEDQRAEAVDPLHSVGNDLTRKLN